MFELLRQQNAADAVSDRVKQVAHTHIQEAGERQFLEAAAKSWRTNVTPTKRQISAPKPRSDHEFFRAVRA
jgi:hypothetical protein